jgi:hypothetical protein
MGGQMVFKLVGKLGEFRDGRVVRDVRVTSFQTCAWGVRSGEAGGPSTSSRVGCAARQAGMAGPGGQGARTSW